MRYFYTGQCFLPLNKKFCFEKIKNVMRFNYGSEEHTLQVGLALEPLMDDIADEHMDYGLMCILNLVPDGDVITPEHVIHKVCEIRKKNEK